MVYYPVDIETAIRVKCKRYRHSPRTAKSYIYWINRFLNWSKKELRYISKKDVNAFLQKLDNQNISGNTLNVAHMAIKFLFEEVMNRKMWINIKYSKTPTRIPAVLSQEDVTKLLNVIKNPKHRFMISFMYGAGLRVSELINLQVKNLVLDKKYGYVRNGKGGKDRLIIIPEKLAEHLTKIIKLLGLTESDYIFVSQRKRKYSIRTIQLIVRKAARLSELKDWKEIHPHTLRHSFATHLIENGYDISNVQAVLGHKSPETTLVYTHIASPNLISVKSPLDNLSTNL